LVQRYPNLVVDIPTSDIASYTPVSLTTDDILYVKAEDPTARSALSCRVAAIRLVDARLLWDNRPTEPDCEFTQSSWLDLTGGVLYQLTYAGGLTAFHPSDGRILWSHAPYAPAGGGLFHRAADTLAVEAGSNGVVVINSNHAGPCQYVILGCDPNNGQFLNVLDPLTGRLYWRYPSYQIGSSILVGGT